MSLSRLKLLFASLATAAVIAPASLMAQVAEVNPYVGWYWPTTSSAGHLKDAGTFGIRAGYFLDSNTEIEGQFGYMNHFQIKGTDVSTRGLLWQTERVLTLRRKIFLLRISSLRSLSPTLGASRCGLTDIHTLLRVRSR